MEFKNQPYTDFKAVNCKDGLARIADGTIHSTNMSEYAVQLAVAPATFTAEREVYAKDADGSLVICGHHVIYGTTTIMCNGNIAANGIATTSCSISGLLTTSYILVNAETSAEVAAFVPFGATCQAAGKAIIQYYVGAATAAITTVPISYIIFNPQTS